MTFAEAVARARAGFNEFARAWDASLALSAFVHDGGDVRSIEDVERALGVTH